MVFGRLFLFVCVVAVFGKGVSAQDSEAPPLPQAVTSFTCHGRPPGYYADIETGCKTYHVCDGISHFTYICPRRTLFQQSNRICDHAYRVACQGAPRPNGAEADEGRISFRLPESEETTISSKEYDDYYDTDEFFSTKTTEFEIDEETETEPYLPPTPASVVKSTPSAVVSTKSTETTETITTPAATTTTQKASTESTTANVKEDNVVQKFLKFRLKDFRSLFFIPEFDNSIEPKPERELVLPLEKSDFLTFKNRRDGSRSFSTCPAYCNPKFFLQGTCHPCIMIK